MRQLWLACLTFAITSQVLASPGLLTTPIMQYQCKLTGGELLLSYFHPNVRPNSISYHEESKIVCHDVNRYGPRDDVMFPRLDEKVATFKVWEPTNPLFYDNNADGHVDVSGLITNRAREYGISISPSTVWFHAFRLPDIQRPEGTLGYIMSPFIDATTFKSYCLNYYYYRSSNRLFKILGDIIDVDTEGLYMGQRLKGKKDFIYINETELKKKWFYYLNGVPTVPDDSSFLTYSVFFVHDGDVFQVKGLNEIPDAMNMDHHTPNGAPTNYPTHDRKIGCVPKP
jgi:hypothetical protein